MENTNEFDEPFNIFLELKIVYLGNYHSDFCIITLKAPKFFHKKLMELWDNSAENNCNIIF